MSEQEQIPVASIFAAVLEKFGPFVMRESDFMDSIQVHRQIILESWEDNLETYIKFGVEDVKPTSD